jgi:hypothetical protein
MNHRQELRKELIMETGLIWLLSSLSVLGLAGFLGSKRLGSKTGQDQNGSRQLEEVVKTAQLTNDTFFRSLELVQKNLESLLARAEAAEQRLRSLMLQPGVEKKEQYTAAALLLNEGQDPQRVAAMLTLPLPQVEVVQELQKMAVKEKKSVMRKKRDEEPPAPATHPLTKNAASREKNAARPTLLADVIKRATNGVASRGNGQTNFGGKTV